MEAVHVHQTQSLLSFSSNICGRMEVVCLSMLAPRKFMQKRRKAERNWRRLMKEIDEAGSAVSVLRTQRSKDKPIPRDLVLGTLMRFKQMRKWNLVSEILEWLRSQHWWSFNEMDYLLLITAYGKLGDFNRAERVLKYMNNKGYAPSVISHTAVMEAYAEAIFQSLLNDARSPFKPDQRMFHMMIYMHKKAGNYDQARRIFAQMADRGIPMSTVTFNSLMSFETNYKEVSNIYDQMQRAGIQPDVVSYALLISAYGKARREDEALAVFEEMLDAGVRPTRKAYNILLDAFAISGMVDEARTVFRSMRRDRCMPDLCSYATMLSAYVNASDMDGAEKFFQRLKLDGFQPNVVIYGTMMKGYAKVNNLEKLMETYEAMRMGGIEGNQTIFTTIMDAHGKSSDFGSGRLPPDQKAKNILLSLAQTPEERREAGELAGFPVDDIAAMETPDFDDGDDDTRRQLAGGAAAASGGSLFEEADSEEEEDDEESAGS
ncbi:unnamed protein product [Spirodela intermedia]|uniref:Uncharacterized protein n=1 Tax=Spirodela intermedia TaxID=51605 RepID=A0A7I8JQR4_SPIIN|nr:unnamed protein product [Spirodela intermedia]CAA6671772.1 unnamed protein product [Spirodela intermedia]